MTKKYVRFQSTHDQPVHYGLHEGDSLAQLDGPPWSGGEVTGVRYETAKVILKAPVQPSKIICIGLNYHAHVAASFSADNAPERPLIFFKPPSAIIGPNEAIVHTRQSQRIDYEAELGVVIGRTARGVSPEEADDHIFGLTCVNDVTARDLQEVDGQWSRAKGFDTFCPTGPWVVTGVDYRDLTVEGVLNDEVRQSGRTSLMIFDIPYLISYVSSIMTLEPGDLISTGTPAGIAPMKPGDIIEVRIGKVGTLQNKVVDAV